MISWWDWRGFGNIVERFFLSGLPEPLAQSEALRLWWLLLGRPAWRIGSTLPLTLFLSTSPSLRKRLVHVVSHTTNWIYYTSRLTWMSRTKSCVSVAIEYFVGLRMIWEQVAMINEGMSTEYSTRSWLLRIENLEPEAVYNWRLKSRWVIFAQSNTWNFIFLIAIWINSLVCGIFWGLFLYFF